ncbi:MAG: hypothetical protein ACRD0P_27690, partial [Stackebrandtia sp.]
MTTDHDKPTTQARSVVPGTANTKTGPLSAGLAYRQLGWPVVLRGDNVSLNLDLDVDAVALVLPATLGMEVTDVLVRRRCPPAVLA